MINSTLFERIANGDRLAYKSLYELYYDSVYSLAFRFFKSPEMAEDLVHDFFVRIWFNKQLLRDVRNANAYIMRAARNMIINKFRDRINTVDFTDHIENYLFESASNPLTEILQKETESLIESAVEKLPPQQQLVFSLSRVEQLSRKEIAEKLDISENTVRNHLNKALCFIRHFIMINMKALLLWVFYQ